MTNLQKQDDAGGAVAPAGLQSATMLSPGKMGRVRGNRPS